MPSEADKRKQAEALRRRLALKMRLEQGGSQQAIMPEMPAPMSAFERENLPRTGPEMRAGAQRLGKFGSDVGRSAASGATLGHIEEINAKARQLMGGGEYLPLLQEEEKRTSEIHPGIRVPGEIAGGLALTPLAGPAAFWSKVPSFLRAAGGGALYGAGYGHGTAKPGERVRGAKHGAALGTLSGGLANLGMVQAPAAAKAFWNAGRAYTSPTKAVPRAIGHMFGMERKGPEDLLENIARYERMGKPGTLADMGYPRGAVQRAARGLAGAGDETGEIVTERLGPMGARARGDIDRIYDDIRSSISSADFFAGKDALKKRLLENATQSYQPAFQQYPSIRSPKLTEILDDIPERSEILKRARFLARSARISGRENFFNDVDKQLDDVAEYGADAIDGLSLQTWDYIKRGLNDIGEESKGAVRSAYRDIQRTLVRELDNLTGGTSGPYARARQIYGDDAQIIGAMEKGSRFLSRTGKDGDRIFKGADEIVREMADLSPAGREAYRMAAVQNLMSEVGETTTEGAAVLKVWNKHNLKNKLEALFENKENWISFAEKMQAEMDMAKTSSFIGHGARSAEYGVDIEKFRNFWGNLGAVLGSNSPFGHALVTSGIARRVATGMFGAPARFERGLAEAVTETDPAKLRALVEESRPYMRSLPRRHPLTTALALEEIQRNQRQQ